VEGVDFGCWFWWEDEHSNENNYRSSGRYFDRKFHRQARCLGGCATHYLPKLLSVCGVVDKFDREVNNNGNSNTPPAATSVINRLQQIVKDDLARSKTELSGRTGANNATQSGQQHTNTNTNTSTTYDDGVHVPQQTASVSMIAVDQDLLNDFSSKNNRTAEENRYAVPSSADRLAAPSDLISTLSVSSAREASFVRSLVSQFVLNNTASSATSGNVAGPARFSGNAEIFRGLFGFVSYHAACANHAPWVSDVVASKFAAASAQGVTALVDSQTLQQSVVDRNTNRNTLSTDAEAKSNTNTNSTTDAKNAKSQELVFLSDAASLQQTATVLIQNKVVSNVLEQRMLVQELERRPILQTDSAHIWEFARSLNGTAFVNSATGRLLESGWNATDGVGQNNYTLNAYSLDGGPSEGKLVYANALSSNIGSEFSDGATFLSTQSQNQSTITADKNNRNSNTTVTWANFTQLLHSYDRVRYERGAALRRLPRKFCQQSPYTFQLASWFYGNSAVPGDVVSRVSSSSDSSSSNSVSDSSSSQSPTGPTSQRLQIQPPLGPTTGSLEVIRDDSHGINEDQVEEDAQRWRNVTNSDTQNTNSNTQSTSKTTKNLKSYSQPSHESPAWHHDFSCPLLSKEEIDAKRTQLYQKILTGEDLSLSFYLDASFQRYTAGSATQGVTPKAVMTRTLLPFGDPLTYPRGCRIPSSFGDLEPYPPDLEYIVAEHDEATTHTLSNSDTRLFRCSSVFDATDEDEMIKELMKKNQILSDNKNGNSNTNGNANTGNGAEITVAADSEENKMVTNAIKHGDGYKRMIGSFLLNWEQDTLWPALGLHPIHWMLTLFKTPYREFE
jgi:hypothetical protein